MPILLLDLPPEILILVFYFLDISTLTACLATNRRVKSIIDGSTLLQYRLALQAACVEDNPRNTTHSVQKLAALQRRQEFFSQLVPRSIRTFDTNDFSLRALTLSGGIIAGAQAGVVKWFSLETEEPVVQQLEVQGYIQDMVLAVPEEDLLAMVVTSRPLYEDHTSVGAIQLHFYEMSTQSAHRMACEPIIQPDISGNTPRSLKSTSAVQNSLSWSLTFSATSRLQSAAFLYTIGGWVAFLWIFMAHMQLPYFCLLTLYCWHKAAQSSTGTLELWTIPDEGATALSPRISLRLPRLMKPNGTYAVKAVESNPKGPGSVSLNEPFHSSFADSVILFQICISVNNDSAVSDLVLPRRGLLELLPPVEESGKELLWREWGPPLAHWVERYGYGAVWLPIICGQRRAFAHPRPGRIRMLDFNPYSHKRLARIQGHTAGEGLTHTIHSPLGEPFQDANRLNRDLFGERVSLQLPCVVADSPQETLYSAVLLDEKWIVAIKETAEVDEDDPEEMYHRVSLEVWHLD